MRELLSLESGESVSEVESHSQSRSVSVGILKYLVVGLVVVIVLFGCLFVYVICNAYDRGYSDGYTAGAIAGVGSGYTIRDPTYAELLAFIAADQTDKNTYDADTYNCYDYTKDVCDNAFKQGYRVGFVYIYFRESAHALVCFNTVDQGLVYVEPQYDEIVNVVVGLNYWTNVSGVKSSFDDTIVRFGIIW
ncbi:MAG: hypothetical protein LBE76_06320 [Nitrososphaerota archaeon]|jgi:hypothetical protein|nr:hypothetical protein [Nitrososphaerota archaeon]